MRRILIALFGCLLAFSAQAQTYKTKAQIQSEFTTNFPDNTTGAITPAILRSTMNDVSASYDQAAGVNAQTGTSYAFVAGDNGQLVTFSNTSSVAVTLSQATTSGFNPFNVTACNINSGTVTITPSTSNIAGFSSVQLGRNQCLKIVSDGTNYQIARQTTSMSGNVIYQTTVNFNSANTDTGINIVLPPQNTFYVINSIIISGASHTLVTATAGVFTAAAGGGTAIVTGASAITVSGTTSGAANSAQFMTVIGAQTVMWSFSSVPTLFFRVANAEGTAATGVVMILITPVG